MAIKGFDSVAALGGYYDGEVFRAIADDTLFVYDRGQNVWLRYRWTQSRREVRFVETFRDPLPIVTQIFPEI